MMDNKEASRKRRKAFQALWTDFVMGGGGGLTPMPGERPYSRAEIVEYMVSPAGRGPLALPPAARAAYEALAPGMAWEAARRRLEGCLLEEGESLDVVEPGLRRWYFQVAANAQFWLEFARAGEGRLVRKSPLEAKCVWHRYADNRISLPLPLEG